MTAEEGGGARRVDRNCWLLGVDTQMHLNSMRFGSTVNFFLKGAGPGVLVRQKVRYPRQQHLDIVDDDWLV